MEGLERLSERPYGALRIYFRPGARSRGQGLLGSLRSRPEYEAVLEAARAHGVPFGKAKHSHMGFVEGEAMRREGVEHANPMLPVYVELLGERETLEGFCEAARELLRGKAMFFSAVERWEVR